MTIVDNRRTHFYTTLHSPEFLFGEARKIIAIVPNSGDRGNHFFQGHAFVQIGESFVSFSDHKEGSNKSCEKRDFSATFSPILLLVLVAPRARSVFKDIEVRSFLVAQVPLVAIAGAAVAPRFPHVKTKGRASQDRPPPGRGVVLQKIVRSFLVCGGGVAHPEWELMQVQTLKREREHGKLEKSNNSTF